MTTQSLLLLILAGIVALGVALFQYFYRGTPYQKLNIILGSLRFLSIFTLFVLLINPTVNKTLYTTVKPVLAVAIDNSSSMAYLGQDSLVKQTIEELQSNQLLKERFVLDFYQFGSATSALADLDFLDSQSNLANPLQNLASIYKDKYIPLLLTDGNATLGPDYEFSQSTTQPVYFLAAGDTTSYEDLKLERINVNRYAYVNNQFPVEVVTSYSGDQSRSAILEVFEENQKRFSKELDFSENKSAQITNFFLPAGTVGIREYTARISALDNEKNTTNNSKNFAVEVIDQKARIAIVYSYLHPDLGALKNAIESNELREVDLVNISDFQTKEESLNSYNLIILFEPTASFSGLYKSLENLKKNRFTIAAKNTDFSFLNRNQQTLTKDNTLQTDETQARLNPNFSAFLVDDDLDYNEFPPLNSAFGNVSINGDTDVLLYKRIASVDTEDPLLAVTEVNSRREVILLGTGLWKWRAQSYRNNQTFQNFDNFIDKLVQFAISNDKKRRLRLDFESFYYGSQDLKIQAQYVDNNYVFDARAGLSIQVRDSSRAVVVDAPMVLKNNFYEVSLDNLEPGSYNFKVSVANSSITESGSFTVIAYDIERQAQNANWDKLLRTAQKSQGLAVPLRDQQSLITNLLNDDRYIPVQKSSNETVDLIDFELLLYVLAGLLAIEWFVRKYNGLV